MGLAGVFEQQQLLRIAIRRRAAQSTGWPNKWTTMMARVLSGNLLFNARWFDQAGNGVDIGKNRDRTDHEDAETVAAQV